MNQTTRPTLIAFASGKGGVGKSTACIALAGALASANNNVHILDFDQNETLWTWYAGHPSARGIKNLTVERAPRTDPEAYVEKLYYERNGGCIMVDLAGHLDDLMMVIAALTDIVIIPTKLGVIDVLQAEKLAEQIHSVGQKIKKPILTRVLLNDIPFAPSNTQMHIRKQIDGLAVQRLQTELHTRPAYIDYQQTGLPLHFDDLSREPTRKAMVEVNALLSEILSIINQNDMKAAA